MPFLMVVMTNGRGGNQFPRDILFRGLSTVSLNSSDDFNPVGMEQIKGSTADSSRQNDVNSPLMKEIRKISRTMSRIIDRFGTDDVFPINLKNNKMITMTKMLRHDSHGFRNGYFHYEPPYFEDTLIEAGLQIHRQIPRLRGHKGR